MKTIFTKLLYELEQQRDTVLVTIVSSGGSTPRGAGAQMLVNAAGRVCGTVGGGSVEHHSIQMAQEFLARHRSGQHTFLLHKNNAEDIGMVCGGNACVWFQYICAAQSEWAALAAALIAQLDAGQGGWLALAQDGAFPTLLNQGFETIAGPAVKVGAPVQAGGCLHIDGYFLLALPVPERAYVFGGGHCAQALVPLLSNIGFCVTVVEARPEFANPALFPQAQRVLCVDYTRLSDAITLSPHDYAVVMTSGHSHDFEIQAQLLRHPLAYIGVIGSRSKKAAVNARLLACGIPPEAIERVHTPIGLDIKAVTPEEIAVSIAAELILERARLRALGGAASSCCPMQ